MNDRDVRKAFHEKILTNENLGGRSMVVDELGLKNGEIRADIAVISSSLIGYEIKTDSDTLKRLTAQMKAYNDVFDQAYCIVGGRHIQSVLNMIPSWWGVYLIEGTGAGSYEFRLIRRSSDNEAKKPSEIVKLLWKEEAKLLAINSLGIKLKSKYTKTHFYDFIVGNYDAESITPIVSQILLSRANWRTTQNTLL